MDMTMVANFEQMQDERPKAKIFISYSRQDMAFVDRLEAALRARNFDPLIDRTEIYAFEDWWKRIETLIDRADTVVFVLSSSAVASEIALKEVTYAASLNKRFAPIVCQRVEDGRVPEPLRRLNFIFFDDAKDFNASADALAEALQTDIGWIRRHTEFGEAARRWVMTGRPGGLLLRSPVLEEAEAWITYRPHGAPPPTGETQAFVVESRKAEVAARRRARLVQAAIYVLMVGIITGLVGWINQDYLKEQWRWYTVTRPYMRSQVRPYTLTTSAERTLRPMSSFRECAVDAGIDYCPEMIVVPGGTFMMGASPGEQASIPRYPSPLLDPSTQAPQHQVTFLKPFAVSKFPVTFDEWDTCIAYGNCASDISDSGFGRGQRPVINVTWEDAHQYAAWLSRMTGKRYRLLTEAEYEYAARGGTQTPYPWGVEIGKGNANCYNCGSQWDKKQTAPVGSFAPNAYGLYDMVGNNWAWVEDCYHPSYENAPTDGSSWTTKCPDAHRNVIRGGSYLTTSDFLRSAFRFPGTTVLRNYGPGFRVARTLAQ
jgi:formylglycine-generating enzyme required for sulfatase activity